MGDKKISRQKVFAIFFCFVLILMISVDLYVENMDTAVNMRITYSKRDFSEHIVKFKNVFLRNREIRKIVIWTSFFDNWNWIKKNELDSCPARCETTMDRGDVGNADAVLFHVSDLWKYRGIHGTIYNHVIPMPEVRTSEQVWVLLSYEPITKFYGKMEHSFNWTITYRRDSMINDLYSSWQKINSSELKNYTNEYVAENVFKTKPKFIATAVSNCFDRAKRYRIIKELGKYINIDKFGRCYGDRTPNLDFLKDYKFYLAIENTHCRDYITEKYWNTLNRKQIPVIATTRYNTERLPPGSFINVFDFDSIKSLADELVRIGNNETLYNSFFDWKKNYTRMSAGWLCRLCKNLHANRTAQSYVDTEAWVRDDMCPKSSAWSMVSEFFQRLLFNIGLT